jgi:PAS domain-containing protein
MTETECDCIRSGYLRQILDILPVGILILEAPDGNIAVANPEMERIHKRKFPLPSSTDEYMEWRLFSMEGRPYRLEEYPHNRSLHKGEVIRGEKARLLRSDDTIISVAVNSAPIYDESGRMACVVVENTDITELERCKNALAGIYR